MSVDSSEFLVAPVAAQWSLDPGAPKWISVSSTGDFSVSVGMENAGDYVASLTARNGSGVAVALVRVHVLGQQQAPSCTLTAKPEFIKLGESLSFTLTTTGEVTSATLGGKPLPFPMHSPNTFIITPAASGVFVASVTVKGPGGEGSCSARYAVK